jgi:putative FmdB family regulatory protein
MPIYAFRCAACGHARDLLMKLGEAAPTTCPACGAESFAKQVTAAGFQLKGSGWYATDFRGGKSGAPADKGEKDDGGAKSDDAGAKPDAKPSADSGAAAPPAAAAASTPAKPSSGSSEPA